jgi:hypothetical protein
MLSFSIAIAFSYFCAMKDGLLFYSYSVIARAKPEAISYIIMGLLRRAKALLAMTN